MFNLLHLSDLHFGVDHQFKQRDKDDANNLTLADAIESALLESPFADQKMDHLFLGGDFFSKDQPKDIRSAKVGIKQIIDRFVGHKENKNSACSIVPGNHDISWDEKDEKYSIYEELCESLSIGRRGTGDNNLELCCQPIGQTAQGLPMYLLLLDSCVVESKEFAGVGRVGERYLTKLRQIVKQKRLRKDSVLLLALHHHLLPLTPEERLADGNHARPSITLDAVAILNLAAELNVSLILHGHQHRSAVVAYRNLIETHTQQLHIAAAGSVGAKTGSLPRQFFVHQIMDHKIVIHLFEQYRDVNRFEYKEERKVSIPLAHINCSVHACQACLSDAESRFFLRKSEVASVSGTDQSNLYLLFLSVKDCPESRAVVRQTVRDLQSRGVKCSLEGMYDLLGKWDLMIRIRYCSTDNFKVTVLSPVRAALVGKGEVKADGPFVFEHKGLIDVQKELGTLSALKDYSTNKDDVTNTAASPVIRRLLKSTKEYEYRRCQRAFVYIEFPAEPHKINGLLRDLADRISASTSRRPSLGLQLDHFPESVLEGFYVGENALVIECFMSCSDTVAINKLNRVIEPALTAVESQKYTLTCYAYDEEECIAALQAHSSAAQSDANPAGGVTS